MELLKQLQDVNKRRPGYLRINDIELDIPPQSISITHNEFDNAFFTLRESAPTIKKSGMKRTRINVSLVFDTNTRAEWNDVAGQFTADDLEELSIQKGASRGWNDLSKLLIQIRKSPIATIENEKIRNELMSGFKLYIDPNSPTAKRKQRFKAPNLNNIPENTTVQTMAVIIDTIQGEVDSENPSLINVNLSMTFFNYLPYSYNLQYANYINQGDRQLIEARPLPTKAYTEFYKSGTQLNGFSLINNPGSVTGSEPLQLFYKKYTVFGSPEHTSRYPEDSKFSFMDLTQESKKNTAKSSDLESAKLYDINAQKFRGTKSYQDGWKLATRTKISGQEDVVIYKWMKIDIPGGNIIGQSGGLLLQNISFSLHTNVAYIPMEKYPIPTAQFMGGSIATARAIFYAPPEMEIRGAGGSKVPVATSKALGKIQNIFDQINYNRTKFAKYSKDDYILLKHPLAQLLKYEPYQNPDEFTKTFYEDHVNIYDRGEVHFDKCFSCVLKDRTSTTVEGLPFASQLQVDFKEQKINIDRTSIKPLIGKNGKQNRTKVMDALKKIFSTLFRRYNMEIQFNYDNSGEFTDSLSRRAGAQNRESDSIKTTRKPFGVVKLGRRNRSAPDFRYALQLVDLMNTSMYLKPYQSIEDMIDDEEAFGATARQFVDLVIENRDLSDQAPRQGRGLVSRLSPQKEFRAFFTNQNHVSYENLGPLLTGIMRATSRSSFNDWNQGYRDAVESLRNVEQIPAISTYPDLLLPTELESPTYYFYEDNYLQEKLFKKAKTLVDFGVIDSEKVTLNTLHGKAVANQADPTTGNARLMKANGQEYVESDNKKAEINTKVPRSYNSIGDTPEAVEDSKQVAAVHDNTNAKDRMQLISECVMGLEGVHRGISESTPAYKILIMEDAKLFSNSEVRRNNENSRAQDVADYYRDLSEFFDLSNIIDIRLSKKEDNPADLMVIRVAGSTGDKVNAMYQEISHEDLMAQVRRPRSLAELTKMEKMFSEKGLREGTRIQLRLGYEADPNELNLEFNGKIVSVSGSDVIEVVCAGNGIELVQDIKAPTSKDTYTYNSNTFQLIRELLKNSPELTSFGTLAPTIRGMELTFLPGAVGGRTVTDNIFAPDLFPSLLPNSNASFFSEKNIGEWTESYLGMASEFFVWGTTLIHAAKIGSRTRLAGAGARLLARHGGKKIGQEVSKRLATKILVTRGAATVGGVILGTTVATVISLALLVPLAVSVYRGVSTSLLGTDFSIYQMTIWDVLQELTLRHPGVICAVVPYGKRSTIYFGEPHQFYYYRPPKPEEIGWIPDQRNTLFNTRDKEQLENLMGTSRAHKVDITNQQRANSKEKKMATEVKIKQATDKPLTANETAIVTKAPFRKYHFVTSEKDIIKNNIQVTSRGTYNSVQVAFPEDSDDGNFDGTVGFSDYEITDKMQADDNIYKEHIRNKVYTFHNAHREDVKDLPQRYAKSLLIKNIEKTYDGKLIIRGRPNIKPHDVIMIYDSYNNIVGPVGVRECVQVVSPTRGWITEIKPKLMVFPDNSSGAMQLSVMKKVCHYLGLTEQELFYTNVRRFMPEDDLPNYGGYGYASDLTKAVNVIANEFGSEKTQDYENTIREANHYTGAWSNAGVSAVKNLAIGSAGVGTDILLNSRVADAVLGGSTTNAVLGAEDAAQALGRQAVQSGRNIRTGGRLVRNSISQTGIASAQTLRRARVAAGAVQRSTVAVGGKALGLSLRVFGAFTKLTGGLALHLMLDSAIEGIISYVKYRQPIMFHPLTRNGQPWYGGMRGYKDNTLIESITEDINRWKNVAEYNQAVIGRYMSRILGD